jgi:ABC-2 type transport system ATP-binding protein
VRYGISVIVASHLLSEIEQVCDFLVAIDGGKLLRAASLASFTKETELLVVEVVGDADAFLQRLVTLGLPARGGAGGSILIAIGEQSPYDVVRDAAAELGVGLMRVARRRDRLEDLFQGAVEAGVPHAAA